MNLFFAQGALDAADKGLDLLERVQAGGVLLISLVVAVACATAFWYQLKENRDLQKKIVKDAEAREIAAKAENTKREVELAEATQHQLKVQEAFLREVMERDRESIESAQVMGKAVEGFEQTQKLMISRIEEVERLLRSSRSA